MKDLNLFLEGQIDTITLFHDFPSIWRFIAAFTVKCEPSDEDDSNNSDTIPISYIFSGDWTNIARSNNLLKSISLDQINGFSSGDFIGIAFYGTNDWNIYARIDIYLKELLPGDVQLIGKIYEDSVLIDSTSILQNPLSTDWVGPSFKSVGEIADSDKKYFVGFDIYYQNGLVFQIPADTGNYHNHQTETISRIGNKWSSLDFVPPIRLVCNPEAVEPNSYRFPILIYPNPTSDFLHIVGENIISVNIFDSKLAEIFIVEENLRIRVFQELKYDLRRGGYPGLVGH